MTVNDGFEENVKEGVVVVRTGSTIPNLREAIEENHEIS
jgi:hypothetical protein